jgi:hypothetical protein
MAKRKKRLPIIRRFRDERRARPLPPGHESLESLEG